MSSIMDDDGEDKEDTKRRTRNLSEKKRRDQFNMLVSELGSMVTTNRSRKMDKSTVLKSTITFIKSHNEKAILARANDVHRDWKPAFLSNEEFTYLVMEALESFVIVFSPSGQIYYVSESITSLLGHNPAHVVNQSIFDLTYEEDRTNLFNLLQNPGTGSESLHKDNEIQFQCRIRRGSPDFSEKTIYEIVQFHGHFRSSMDTTDDSDGSSFHENEEITLFVCTGRLYTPQLIRDVSLVDSSRCEFTSRHSLEWKFLFLDHRAPPIIGYLPFEVLGTSGYDYYHFDDLEKVVTCHEALMQKGELTSCYYRFLTKGQQWIWLQTRFYITYHQWNSKPEFVVCTHQVVNYADVVQSTKQEAMDVDITMEVESKQSVANETPTETSTNAPMSPSYMSEASDAYGNSYHTLSKTVSLKSASSGTVATTSAASWPQGSQYTALSDTASVSGESLCSHLNPTRNQPLKWSEPAPQHGIGAQYLDPVPFVGTVQAVGVPSIVPISLPSLPVIVADQTQIQGQLHRKHEELQQMIVRQQEELRQVKEQLLLARLGILQPLLNVPHAYAHAGELPPNARVPAQLVYEDPRGVGPPVYHHQHTHPNPNHSPHDPEHHQHHHHMQ